VWAVPLAAAPPAPRFTRLSVEQGLSQSSVQVILQDHVGFVWLGTDEGLNRYDGYEFVVFRHDPQDPGSLPNETIWSLLEDRDHRLWVGTDRGLSLLDPATERFAPVPSIHGRVTGIVEDADGTLWVASEGGGLFHREASGRFVLHDANPDDPGSLSTLALSALFRDHDGRLWIGTRGHGVDMLARTSPARGRPEGGPRPAGRARFVHYHSEPGDPDSLGRDEVWGFAEDRGGRLWIASHGGGVSVLDPSTGRFRRYRHDASVPGSLRTDLATCVFVDHDGVVWVGTDGAGVERFDPVSDSFTPLLHDAADPTSLSQNVVRTLYEDVQGQLWVGTYLGGANVLKHPRQDFRYFSHDPRDPASLSDAAASFLEDALGQLWVGTGHGWLDRFDPAKGTFAHHRFPSAVPEGLAILSLYQDRAGRIWAGTYRGGLGRFDPARGSFQVYRHRPGDPHSLGNDEVWAIAEDARGELWLGTNGGLDRFDPATATVTAHYDTYRAEGLSDAGVRTLLCDSRRNLWVGTLGGLNLLLEGGGGFVRYRHADRDPGSLSHDIVVALHEDGRGRLWVGTFGGGLGRLDQATGSFQSFQGFPSHVVYRIEEDRSGRLWLSTNHGLSRFDPESGQVDNFDLNNGLQSLQFRIGGSLRTRKGRLLFASVDGFYEFDPDAIRPDTYAPPVVFTSLRAFNGPSKWPAAQLAGADVALSHEDKTVSVEFAALDYTFPKRNQYAYLLQGVSNRWIGIGARREVTLTNLEPGSYVLRVKASNRDGVWNDAAVAALRLVVQPPFWRTLWFRALALALLALALAAAHRARVRHLTSDIQQQRQVEAALREAKERYRGIVENAHEGIFQSTGDGRILTANPALARMLGYDSPEQLMAEVADIGLQLYVDPERRAEMMRQVQDHGHALQFEAELRRRDGRTVWVSQNVRVVRDEAGRVLYYEGTSEDTSDRRRARQAEAALRAALEREAEEWQLTFDSLEAPVLVVDEGGRIVHLNHAARALAATAERELVGRRLADVARGEPWQAASAIARQAGRAHAVSHVQANDAATGRVWDLTARPSAGPDDGGRIVVVAREITGSAEA